jgi:hypothetical protein
MPGFGPGSTFVGEGIRHDRTGFSDFLDSAVGSPIVSASACGQIKTTGI